MATLIGKSRWLAGVAVLLIISAVWAQSRGTSEDESAVKALLQGADGDDKNATKARQYAVDADWTNSFGERLHGREALLQKFDELAHSAFYQAGRDAPGSDKVDVRFARPMWRWFTNTRKSLVRSIRRSGSQCRRAKFIISTSSPKKTASGSFSRS
jgi:hypothetical protein